jgi:hypothetical protein
MFDPATLQQTERKIGFSYPPSFHARFPELLEIAQSNSRFKKIFPNTRLITTLPDIRDTHRNGLPTRYIPFLMQTQQPAHTDYYAFDKKAQAIEKPVCVFAIHTIVEQWDNFEAFLAWLGEQTKDNHH